MELGVVHFNLDAGLDLLPRFRVDTLPKLAGKQIDAHDGEYQPEDEAHEQHISNRGYGTDQRIHNDLHPLETGKCSKWAQGSQCSQRAD